MQTSGYCTSTCIIEMEEISGVTQKSTNTVSTPVVSKDVNPSHCADTRKDNSTLQTHGKCVLNSTNGMYFIIFIGCDHPYE